MKVIVTPVIGGETQEFENLNSMAKHYGANSAGLYKKVKYMNEEKKRNGFLFFVGRLFPLQVKIVED